jgi:outer membrane protein TolC
MDGGGTERMLSLMLGVNVPLWAGSRQLKMRDEAAAMRQMAQADLDAMRAETRGRIGELVTELGRTRRLRSLYLHSILPQAEATATSARTAYQVGNVDFMTLLDALMAVNTYRELVPQLEAQEGQAFAELEMLTGLPLVPGVPTVEDTIPGGSQ